jgi:Holliday junction DNA helicase RuvA
VIATLAGRLRRKGEDRVVLEVGGVGYEVYLPPIALRALEGAHAEDGDKAAELALVIYYHATRDQPRPVLIGFTSDLDKEFFEKLITVKDIGPMVAARALAAPVAELAAAIARQDEKYLRGLPGIGPQKAKNIVAQLQAKVAKFALAREGEPGAAPADASARPPDADGLREVVWEVLTKQLGHRPSEASQLITDALRRRPAIATPEELFDEIYRGQAAAKART